MSQYLSPLFLDVHAYLTNSVLNLWTVTSHVSSYISSTSIHFERASRTTKSNSLRDRINIFHVGFLPICMVWWATAKVVARGPVEMHYTTEVSPDSRPYNLQDNLWCLFFLSFPSLHVYSACNPLFNQHCVVLLFSWSQDQFWFVIVSCMLLTKSNLWTLPGIYVQINIYLIFT